MANQQLVGNVSAWQSVKSAVKAAVQMRFSGAYGGSYGGGHQSLDENFTRNMVRRALGLWAGSGVNFAQEAGDPTLSSLVMAAVNWLGRTMPEAPLVIKETDKQGQENIIADHPALLLLRRPNQFYSGSVLLKAFASHWITGGNVYWLKVRNARGQLVELWNVPPLETSLSAGITPRWPVDGTEFISFYEYQVEQHRYDLPPSDVLHFRNGLDVTQRIGVSPIEPVYREIFKDNEESNYGALLAKNGAIPPVVLSLTESTVDNKTELEAYKEDYQRSTQGDNRGKVFVSNQRVEITKLGFTPSELDLRSAHRFNEERFAAVIGVPAIVLGFGAGLESSTYNNTEQADERAVENFLIPLWRYVEDELTHQLGPDYKLKPNQRFAFDLRAVRALADDEDALYKRITLAYRGDWIKRGEARIKAGLAAGPDDDLYFSQATAKPQQLAEQSDGPGGQDGSETDEELIQRGRAFFAGSEEEAAAEAKRESYFSHCPRDKQGRCESSGRTLESKAAYRARTKGRKDFVTYADYTATAKYADEKISNAPTPSKEAVAKAQKELELARQGKIRAGGESRGGGSKDRRRQRENLFKEFGGEERGHIACHGCGLKLHHDPPAGSGFGRLERGKIFVKCQGGGYQLANLLPECFTCNRSRNDAQVRKENPC